MLSCCDKKFILKFKDKKVKIPDLDGTYRIRGLVENLDGTIYAKIQKVKSDEVKYYELQKMNETIRRFNRSLLQKGS